MTKRSATAYAIVLLVLLVCGMIAVVAFAFSEIDRLIEAIVGLLVAFVFAPVYHELGHVALALGADMQVVYVKCFCFRYVKKGGRGKLRFCSPFAPDETQVVPKKTGSMKKRALWYTLGGLLLEGAFFLVLAIAAAVTAFVGAPDFKLFAMLPYAAYLFFLNVAPFEYPSGKTDALIARGIIRGEPAETVMLAVMEAHGALFEGKSFGELDAETLFSLPQLAEDEPLFAATLDLKYRYALENEDYELAQDCLKRLAASEDYLSDEGYFSLRVELVYFSLLCAKVEPLKKLQETDEAFLRSEDYKAKRILALYSTLAGKEEEGELLIGQAKKLLEKEPILGVKKFEEKLLERIKTDEKDDSKRV